MNNLINKVTFKKIFRLDKNLVKLNKWSLYNMYQKEVGTRTIFIDNYILVAGKYFGVTKFEKTLVKLGFTFSRVTTRNTYGEYKFFVADEYIESVKNLMLLIDTDEVENIEVAYQIFQNIKLYKNNKNN